MAMTATAHRLDGGLKHLVDVNGRHTVVTDEPAALGGTDEGPAPHELLAAAVAACVSTMIAMYALKRGWDLGEIDVEVSYDTDAVPRRMVVGVHLPAGLSAEQRRRLERVAQTCPVRRALEAGIVFEEQLLGGGGAERISA